MPRLGSRHTLSLVLIAGAAAAIAFPLGAFAAHQFTDVPDTSAYHADIDAVADAGVTTGCGNGTTFCPKDNVTREQMAAFMNRLGALAPGKTPVVNATKLDGLDSTQFLRADSPVTGHSRCGSGSMSASGDGPGGAWSRNAVDVRPLTSSTVVFYCDIILPNGANVVAVRWQMFDTSATESVSCELDRTDQTTIGIMGTASTTLGGTPGYTTIEDTSILGAAVSQDYQYVASCILSGDGTGWHRADVEYTFLGLPVP